VDEPVGLTRLMINNCYIEYFIFNTPNLKYFKYSRAILTSNIYVCPNVIEEVYIDFALELEFNELFKNQHINIQKSTQTIINQ
jgi:hypothetical protein